MDWRARAACLGHDPELWFPVGISAAALEQAQQAILVCRACPVVAHCAAHATAEQEPWGVWGGVHRGMDDGIRTACGTQTGYYAHKRLGEPLCTACRADHEKRTEISNEARRRRRTRARAAEQRPPESVQVAS